MARTNWKAKYEAAAAELEALKAQRVVTHSSAPKAAALVYVDGRPFFTALTHSAAYKLMVAVKAKGHRSVYKPLH